MTTPSPANQSPKLPDYTRIWSCDASEIYHYQQQDTLESFRAALCQAASRHMTGRSRIHMIWIKKCPTGPHENITLFNHHPYPAFTEEALTLFPGLCHEFRRLTEYRKDNSTVKRDGLKRDKME